MTLIGPKVECPDEVRRYAGIPDDAVAVEQYENHQHYSVVWRFSNGRSIEVSRLTLERLLPPPPDPLYEAFMGMAVALHEGRKRREREERAWGTFLAAVHNQGTVW